MPRYGMAVLLAMLGAFAQPMWAESISPRPAPRAISLATVAPSDLPGSESVKRVSTARPRARPALPATETATEAVEVNARNVAFREWLGSFRGRALAQGVRGAVFDAAFDGVVYDSAVVQRDRNQSEFTKTIWEYLDSAASDPRIENGRAALTEHAALFEAIEARYGVEKEVVAAVWGLESAYGSYRGTTDIVQALATLAFDGRRGRFFEAQLVAALQILQSGDVPPREMTGSWAGAMGHTQFIPTSYLTYAVDFTGDGRRNIWSDDPADALASTASYLAGFGWQKGMPWGVEVRLPKGFDFALARRSETRLPSEWAEIGVVGTDGRAIDDHGPASVLLPAGARGAAFLIFSNFDVLERYNTADAYVIGVGHLADRLRGAGPIVAEWPRGDRALTQAERREMQERLTQAGFDTRGVDGRIGPLTVTAIRSFQRDKGMLPDGYASLHLLDRLR